ncbi:MAG TPA: hypothetical protein VHM90_10770 [Phycisphaerae bacterium]|nr:hypothetical protein [Phycisphaerae bacterium]
MLRGILLGLMLVWMAAFLGGCSAIRWGVMDHVGKTEVPVMVGGRLLKTEVVPWAAEAAVTLTVQSPWGKSETLDWYRKRLLAAGWELKAENENWSKGYGSMDGDPIFLASRKRWSAGSEWLSKEELMMILGGRDEKAVATITIKGDYVWDWPSRGANLAVTQLVMIPAWGFIELVTVVHGGEVILAFLDAPLMVPLWAARVAF